MDLSWMLALACAGEPEYRQACKKSAEAGMHQSGLYSYMETIEYSASKRAKIEMEQLGVTEAFAAGGFVYKVVKDKNIGYTFRRSGVLAIDDLGVNAGLKGAGVNLHWTLD